jgi:multimeric flavodoxin WrbA
MNGNPMNGSPMNGNPMNGSPMNGNPMNGSPVNESPVNESPMGRPIRLLSITASPHGRRSNTHQAHQGIIAAAKAYYPEIEDRVIHLAEKKIELCTGCGLCFRREQCHFKDDVAAIVDEIEWADGILFGSPVYVMHITGLAKVFIDRLVDITHRPTLQHKYVIVTATSAGLGAEPVLEYLTQVWNSMGASVIGGLEAQSLVPGRFLNRGWLHRRYQELAREWVDAIRERRVYPLSDYERARLDKFRGMIGLPKLGEALFKADYEFWKEKEREEAALTLVPLDMEVDEDEPTGVRPANG